MTLFAPLTVGPLTLPNRIVLPAMVTRLSGEDGHVNPAIIDRYVRFAKGEPALIVIEAMGISQAKSGPLLRLGDDEFLPGLRRLADAIHHTAAVLVVPQIIHFLKISRSGWRQTIADLTTAQIHDLIQQFAAAAVRARRAGCDGVELHMAHAYTLSSFLSRRNRLRDEYGGSLANRLRAPTQALQAVRQAVGRDFLIGVRFDGEECITDGYSLRDAQQIAVQLGRHGADYVSISAGGKFEDAVPKPGQPLYPYTGYSGDRCMPGKAYPDGFNLYLPTGIRQALHAHGLSHVRVIGSGKIWSPEHAEQLVREQVDLVGMARQLLADPDWPLKVRRGRRDTIVFCEYGNVCKALDENFQRVRCTLWPKDALHAPESLLPRSADPPSWPAGGAELKAELGRGRVRLTWQRAQAASASDYARPLDAAAAAPAPRSDPSSDDFPLDFAAAAPAPRSDPFSDESSLNSAAAAPATVSDPSSDDRAAHAETPAEEHTTPAEPSVDARTPPADELYGYQLLRGEGQCSVAELLHYASVRAATPAFLDTELLDGQTYTYAVQPYDRRGVRGPRSAPLQLTLPTADRDL